MTHSQEKWQQAYTQFSINICRIHRLLDACTSHTTIGPSGHKELDGVGDDIARAAIVFLHATFEDFLRSVASRKKCTYSTRKEAENALRRLGVDYSRQQKYLASLDQMMLRRHRIVHHADVLRSEESEPNKLTYEESVTFTRWFLDVDFFVSEIAQSRVSQDYAVLMQEKLEEKKATRREFENGQPEH